MHRFCTEKYSPPKASNLDVAFMHLTNYAVNKKNEAFVSAAAASADGSDDASKWCLAQLRHYIESTGGLERAWRCAAYGCGGCGGCCDRSLGPAAVPAMSRQPSATHNPVRRRSASPLRPAPTRLNQFNGGRLLTMYAWNARPTRPPPRPNTQAPATTRCGATSPT